MLSLARLPDDFGHSNRGLTKTDKAPFSSFETSARLWARRVRSSARKTNAPARLCVVAAYLAEGFAMAEILEGNRVVTQITTVKLTPDKQDEVLNLMIERARS